jgi:hypothetical protein
MSRACGVDLLMLRSVKVLAFVLSCPFEVSMVCQDKLLA